MLEPRLMLKDIRIEVRPDVHWNKGGGGEGGGGIRARTPLLAKLPSCEKAY